MLKKSLSYNHVTFLSLQVIEKSGVLYISKVNASCFRETFLTYQRLKEDEN